MTNEEMKEIIRANVRRGAELLDKYVPGWYETVHGAMVEGIFDMCDPHCCILGSLELVGVPRAHNAYDPFVQFNGVLITAWDNTAAEYGFHINSELDDFYFGNSNEIDYPWHVLEKTWQEVVEERKLAAAGQ